MQAGIIRAISPSRLKNPVLSIILCSRNDNYMGNPRWRLQTALNFLADNVHELGREEEVEIIVADWGSEIPLHKVLRLSGLAARMVSFVVIPSELACELQKDSPFSEVHALNAAARRANGQYIGRIDQDTLIGKRFLKTFFELYEGKQLLNVPLNSAILFANRRSIPYRFASRCPPYDYVDRFVRLFSQSLKVWKYNPHTGIYWTSYVGMLLLYRDIWNWCGGYDEKLIYYDWMEVDIILRLKEKYAVVDLGKLVNYDFYHLDHYQLRASWSAVLHPRAKSAKSNPYILNLETPPTLLHPNSKDWGLGCYPLEIVGYSPNCHHFERAGSRDLRSSGMGFTALLFSCGSRMLWDRLNVVLFVLLNRAGRFVLPLYRDWRRRARVAWETICDEPSTSWPGLLVKLWITKRRNRLQQKKN